MWDRRQERVGLDVGVEHASPAALQAAVASARPSQPQRKEFSREDLERAGLTCDFDQPPLAGAGAKAKREVVCDALGIGRCDGKQLLKQLNVYGFTRQEFEAALHLTCQNAC